MPKIATIEEFVSALPKPKNIGSSEYAALVAFIQTVADSSEPDSEEQLKLLESSLDEIFGYVVSVRERVREINRGREARWGLVGQ